jgi:acyl-CoA synthetase (AMP-forming)/AMP-acid ligase II
VTPTAPTVPVVLAERAASRAEHPFLICDDDVLTYAEADARSADLARSLVAEGAGKGTRIGLLHPNGSAFVVAWLAVARIGAVTLPLSTFSTRPELRTLLRNADVEVLLATPALRGRDVRAELAELVPSLDPPILHPDLPALRRVVLSGDPPTPGVGGSPESVTDQHLAALAAAVRPADRMVVVHTSGSTSEPKGVVHQHGSLIRHLGILNELRRYTPDEVLFSNSPFFWIGGFAYSLLGTLLAGATLVCTNATDTSAALDVLERTRPTMVNGFAAAVAHLAKDPTFPDRDLSSIRRGNLWPLLPAAIRPADPELRHDMLGMTETGSVCLAGDDEGDQPEHRRGSFGKPVPGLEADVVDGELRFRGPALMEGYLGREHHETFTAEGWYRTGDLVHVDADGFVYFHGRAGDMIKTAGANVAPREVEAAILAATGLVAHVVGVADPDRGQVVVAAVRTPEPLDEAELRAALREHLSAYKVPRRFVPLADEDVPMLSSGKVDAQALRRLLAGEVPAPRGEPEAMTPADHEAVPREPRWTVGEVLRRNADERGGAAAIVTSDASLTHAELDDRSRVVAGRLVAVGVGKGARLGLLAPNGIEWVVAAMAAARIGATLVPLSTLARPPELAALLRTADVTHLVAAERFKGRRPLDEASALAAEVRSLRWTSPLAALVTDEPEAIALGNHEPVPRELVDALEAAVHPADDLVVLFTSGSTGAPKGAIHTHGGALAASAANLDARRLGPGERLYMPMPFFWTGGFATALVSSLVAGATLLTEAEPEPARTLAFLERERVTLFRGWPDQAAALAAHPAFAATDLSGLGDASLAAVLPAERRPSPGVRPNIFGMTETFGPWCGDRLDVDLPPSKRGSCGRPLPGIEVRAVDGELQLRGPNLFRTYAGRERGEVVTADGWFRTGDAGRVDADGYVWFDGRVDDMLKVKGATVYPAEVEAALRAVDGVRQAHVTDVGGEIGAAVVTDLDAAALRTATKARLSAFKVPTRWLVSADPDLVPMTATGKVDTQALRALLEEMA